MDETKEAAAVVEEAGITPEVTVTEPVIDPIAEKDATIAQLTADLENYKNVALKRLGKLPGDAGFLEGADEKTGLTIEEMVKKTLIEREISLAEQAKDTETRKILKENAELKLALKNRPGASLGADGGSSAEVKDSVFSEAQIQELTRRAQRLNLDPVKFIAKAKTDIASRA